MVHSRPAATPPTSTVVVGATGILAPLAALLDGAHALRVGVSRGLAPARGDWDRIVHLDATDPSAIEDLRSALPPMQAVIAYQPALSPDSWRSLTRDATRSVLLVPSAFAEPGRESLIEPWLVPTPLIVVILGWAQEKSPDGAVRSRWHTPDEIAAAAAAAMAALAEPPPALDESQAVTRTLGTTRPWTDRP